MKTNLIAISNFSKHSDVVKHLKYLNVELVFHIVVRVK